MGAFDDAVTAALAVWFGEDMDPETVYYNSIPVPAHVSFGEDKEYQGFRDGVAASGTLILKAEDVPSPVLRDTVVIGSDTWSVVRILDGDGYMWTLQIERDVRSTFQGSGVVARL